MFLWGWWREPFPVHCSPRSLVPRRTTIGSYQVRRAFRPGGWGRCIATWVGGWSGALCCQFKVLDAWIRVESTHQKREGERELMVYLLAIAAAAVAAAAAAVAASASALLSAPSPPGSSLRGPGGSAATDRGSAPAVGPGAGGSASAASRHHAWARGLTLRKGIVHPSNKRTRFFVGVLGLGVLALCIPHVSGASSSQANSESNPLFVGARMRILQGPSVSLPYLYTSG